MPPPTGGAVMVLTQEQRDFFCANGYLPYGKILSDDEIQLYRREYDHEFAKANDDGSYQNLTVEWDATKERKQTAPLKMLQIMQMCERNIQYRRLIYHTKILDIVQELIGPNIQLFHD